MNVPGLLNYRFWMAQFVACAVFGCAVNGATHAHAWQDGAPADTDPFVAYAWTGTAGRYAHVLPTFWLVRNKLDVITAKRAMDAMPAGHRAMLGWDVLHELDQHPYDVCRNADGKLKEHPGIWWEYGVTEVAPRFESFFDR